MLADLLTLPCTVLTRTSDADQLDDYGNPVAVDVETSTVCELQQRSRPEDTAAGSVAATTWALFLPAGTDVTAGSAVVVGGATYEIDGTPWPARNPRTGLVEHIEATVVLTQGSA